MNSKDTKPFEKEKKTKANLEKNREQNAKEVDENEHEKNGVIPEGLDFKKFLGCGG